MHHAQPPNPWASPPSLPRHLDLPRPPTVPQDSKSVSRLFRPPQPLLIRRRVCRGEPQRSRSRSLPLSSPRWRSSRPSCSGSRPSSSQPSMSAARSSSRTTRGSLRRSRRTQRTCSTRRARGPLGEAGGGDRYGSASETPEPSPSRRRNPSLECPRSQRKPMRRGRQKGMAAVTVRLPAQHVRRTCARQ